MRLTCRRKSGSDAVARPVWLGVALAAVLVTAQAARAEVENIVLPSGLEAHLQEQLVGASGASPVDRFRFVAPGFTGDAELEVMMADLEFLCQSYALPRLENPGQVIISLADQPSEFGHHDPEIRQVFEAYSIRDGQCIWELY